MRKSDTNGCERDDNGVEGAEAGETNSSEKRERERERRMRRKILIAIPTFRRTSGRLTRVIKWGRERESQRKNHSAYERKESEKCERMEG